jgi:hypothetical protein
MTDEAQATAVFDRLADIFTPYRSTLVTRVDEPGNLYLETPPSTSYPSGLFFGAVKIGKRYVSFHLMPIYVHPNLLDGISPGLRKRMQGKSCFNFTRQDDELLRELETLTAAGFTRFQEDGAIPVTEPATRRNAGRSSRRSDRRSRSR